MKRLFAPAFVALAVLLTGCGSSISAGTITDKVIEPESTWVQMICAGYNKDGMCISQVPIIHTDDEDYRFDIKDQDGDTGYVYVSYGTFESYQIGDYYNDEQR
jgi:hypothetical protein